MSDFGPVDFSPIDVDSDTVSGVESHAVSDLGPSFTRTFTGASIGRRLVTHGRALLHRIVGDKTVDFSPIDLDDDLPRECESWGSMLAEVSESVEPREGWSGLTELPDYVGPPWVPSRVQNDIAPGSRSESESRAALVRDLAPEFTRTLAALELHPVSNTPIGRRLLAHGRALLHRMVEDKTWPVELFGLPSQVSDVLDQLGRLARHTGRSTGPVLARLAARIALLVTLLGSGRPRPVEGRSSPGQTLPWRYVAESSQPNAPPYAPPAYVHKEHAHALM